LRSKILTPLAIQADRSARGDTARYCLCFDPDLGWGSRHRDEPR